VFWSVKAIVRVVDLVAFRSLQAIVRVADTVAGGACPWCGSNWLWGRGEWRFRKCNICGVRFNDLCPICKNPSNSLGFSERKHQWGCDRCGSIFDESKAQLDTEEVRNARGMWLAASGFRLSLSLLWLTMGLVLFTLILIVVAFVALVLKFVGF